MVDSSTITPLGHVLTFVAAALALVTVVIGPPWIAFIVAPALIAIYAGPVGARGPDLLAYAAVTTVLLVGFAFFA